MAEIAPFRGILYTRHDASKLLAPPYDVINEAERADLEALDPANCVRLILPRPVAGQPDDSKYDHAATLMKAWLADGTLARDAKPAVYRYHQLFRANDQDVVRKGYIARVRLHRFDEGVILPHERTLSGPKMDRLKLMRATHAHFSQIFGLYPDPARESDRFFERVEGEAPAIEGKTADGVTQRLWRLTDAAALRGLMDFMADRKIYIADGHHRYETMLTLRDELRPLAEAAGTGARSAVEYGVMFFCNMDDPGLVVLGTHRVLHGLASFDRASLLSRASAFFTIEEKPIGDVPTMRATLARAADPGVAFGVMTPDSSKMAILRLREDLDPAQIPSLPQKEALRTLDVTVLHALILENLLGIDREAQAKQTNLRYVKTWDAALAERTVAGTQAVFLMNPTKVSQVKAVSDIGEVMPQKSTFFYPKIASGLVSNPIDPAETVDRV